MYFERLKKDFCKLNKKLFTSITFWITIELSYQNTRETCQTILELNLLKI